MLQIPPTPTTRGSGTIECWPKNKSAQPVRDARGLQEGHAITFFDLQCLNKIKAVSLSSISLRSELQADSYEELSCELELYLSEVRSRQMMQVCEICRLLVDDMTWRVYAFPPCKAHRWQCASISRPGCKDRLPHWLNIFSPGLKVLQTVIHDVIHDYFKGLRLTLAEVVQKIQKVTLRVEPRNQLQRLLSLRLWLFTNTLPLLILGPGLNWDH